MPEGLETCLMDWRRHRTQTGELANKGEGEEVVDVMMETVLCPRTCAKHLCKLTFVIANAVGI